MANKRKNNNINTNNDELLETNNTENLTSEEEIKETEEHIQTVEKVDETEAKEAETTVEQTITEVKEEPKKIEEPVATEIKEEPVAKKKEKASFKSFFRYKNGKPIKYVEDNGFNKEMKTIAKQRGYYEDIFKTNVLN